MDDEVVEACRSRQALEVDCVDLRVEVSHRVMMTASLEDKCIAGSATGEDLVRAAPGDEGVVDAWRAGDHRAIGVDADHELRLGRIGRGDVAGVTLRPDKGIRLNC